MKTAADKSVPKTLRRDGARLEAPTLVFRQGDREIKVYGVVHLAPQEHWDDLGRRLGGDEERGAAIHLEGVQRPSSPVLGTVRLLAASLQQTYGLAEKMLPHLVHQKVGLTVPMTAERVDLRAEEVARAIPVHGRLGLAAQWLLSKGVQRLPEGLLVDIGKEMEGGFGESRRSSILSRGTNAAVLDLRNLWAISHALEEAHHRDVVLVWGAAHLPGMAALLGEEGWRIEETSWRLWKELPEEG